MSTAFSLSLLDCLLFTVRASGAPGQRLHGRAERCLSIISRCKGIVEVNDFIVPNAAVFNSSASIEILTTVKLHVSHFITALLFGYRAE